ncbi:MAG: hypothetical protein JW806_09255 [Sedimentisphaerales bacterium]|nr:hypothetical protein [Sedimentisphaerales bacterium]
MPLIKVNWNPNRKKLRNFSKIGLVISTLVLAFFYAFKGMSLHLALVLFGAVLIIFISSMTFTGLARAIYIILIMVTVPIGVVISFLLLSAFYYLLLTPIGLFFRLTGRDPLHLNFDSNTQSYWIARQGPERLDRYFNQF